VVKDPHTHKNIHPHTHEQDRLQYTAPQLARSVKINNNAQRFFVEIHLRDPA